VLGRAKPPAARAAGRTVGVEAAPKGPVTFMQDVSFYASTLTAGAELLVNG